ncbi:hypothetical protein GCM10027187_15450 [Streptosporangium sandarakinum]|uniref:MmyB family transcriptional regulator n=1 Tax=Streptosporangium sandarakinum TaxID=1260955 RepID=UPI00248341C8|nr:hypothetical protein [Streptosporangium sandarakinum]
MPRPIGTSITATTAPPVPSSIQSSPDIAGTDPDAPDLASLVGELIVKSPDFNRLWERYEVRAIGDGTKTLRHPEVGTMTLSHEGLPLNRAQGRRLIVHMAPPGSPDHDAMTLLDLAASGSSGGPGGTAPVSPSRGQG